MGTRKGQKHYPKEFKEMIVLEHYQGGKSLRSIVKEYGISLSRLCVWCSEYRDGGFSNIGHKSKGRPRKTPKPEQTQKDRIKQLEMEVELLKAFLYEAERWNARG